IHNLDYSSLSDSQLLFGSQFCPENVQSAAAPLELGTQLGQHNSQDVSLALVHEPSIFTKYQTKPLLFDEDTKEKGSLNFGAGRLKSVLENFEVNKNKIKDKYDRYVDIHWKFFLCWWLSLPVAPSSPLKMLKALTDKSQMEQALLEMERRLAAVSLLKEGLESLPAQLSDQHLKLCEELGFLKLPNALAELYTFISSARLPPHVADNSSQTSPGPCHNSVLGKENACWPCCQGRGVCSSSSRSQPPCMAVGEQHGDSQVGNQVTGDGISKGDLNTALGGKVSPIATVVCGRENTSLQEVKYSLETQSCANQCCMCCTNSHFLGVSQKKHCPVPQEVPLPTPLRKAVRRGNQGFEPMTPAQQRQPQVCHLSVRKDTPGQKDSNWATDGEVENAAAGNKAKQRPGRIPRNKAKARKKTCPTMRKGELSRCSDGGLKQRKANRIIELESSRKNCFPRYTVALNLGSSNPVFAAPSQQILSSAQLRLTKNFPAVPCSNKSLQQVADKRKRSLEIKKRANASSVKRNLWDSSPQENVFSLCSTIGEKQMSCFSLQSPAASKKPRPVNTLAQQNTACCSLVFDSDYSD
uniref:Interactor of HORMAD1 1 n=1 Tax=Aquila chrysaetos chrysaetos TaxID=223781 RepID=A0A663ESA0_AQUCH